MRSRMRIGYANGLRRMLALAVPLGSLAVNGCGANPDSEVAGAAGESAPGVDILAPTSGEARMEGRVEAVAYDDIGRKGHWIEYFLRTPDGQRQKLEFPTSRHGVLPGESIQVMAKQVGDKLIVSPDGVEGIQRTGGVAPKAVAPLGNRRIAVILAKVAGDTNPYFTQAVANGYVFTNTNSVANYYKQASYDKATFSGTTFDWRIVTGTSCDAAKADAEAQVEALPGVDLNTYDHIMFLVPGMADICGITSGFADMPNGNVIGRRSTIINIDPRLMTHELGHNLGAGHSNAWTCIEANDTANPARSIRVPLDVDAKCLSDEYDDMWDPMGVGYSHFHSYNKWRFGYMPTSNQTDVTTDGEFTILPIEQNLVGLQSLRVRRTSGDPNAQYFYLDFRQPLAPFDAFQTIDPIDPVINGVTVRLGPANAIDGPTTMLVDARPQTTNIPFDGDETVQAGTAIYDPNGRNAFYVLSAGPSGARVRVLSNRNPIKINFQPATAPVPAGYLVDSGATFGDRGNGQSYGWNVSNTANAVDLNSPSTPGADQRYDTFEHLGKSGGGSVWELAVPNGTYLVRIAAGDNTTNAFYHTLAENQVVLSDQPVTDATWLHRSKVVTVSDGRLTITNGNGAMNNKLNFIEVVSLDIGGGTPPLLSANFNSGTDSFTYADNTFRNANNGAYASGTRLSTGGASGTGGLQVLLGGVDSLTKTVISGGWKRTFTLAQGATVTLNLDYNMTINNYESDEYSEVLASIDGILTGTGGNSEVARLTGGSASSTTGWKSSTTLVAGWFPAGTHTLIVGGHNNKKNASNETTDIRIDNVVLRTQ